MGGHGHGDHSHRNHNNIKESDAEMQNKIQRIDTIKHMPNHWHLDFWNVHNMYTILGGFGTAAYTFLGASLAVMYFKNGAAHGPQHFHMMQTRMWGRIVVGGIMGLTLGYFQFGDRQKLHNAWVAERLRRRYPDCMNLVEHDLWELKGVKAEHSYYKWV